MIRTGSIIAIFLALLLLNSCSSKPETGPEAGTKSQELDDLKITLFEKEEAIRSLGEQIDSMSKVHIKSVENPEGGDQWLDIVKAWEDYYSEEIVRVDPTGKEYKAPRKSWAKMREYYVAQVKQIQKKEDGISKCQREIRDIKAHYESLITDVAHYSDEKYRQQKIASLEQERDKRVAEEEQKIATLKSHITSIINTTIVPLPFTADEALMFGRSKNLANMGMTSGEILGRINAWKKAMTDNNTAEMAAVQEKKMAALKAERDEVAGKIEAMSNKGE